MLNLKDNHDWGDDFAQYILQARNIIDGRPQTGNGLVFEESSEGLALRAYPVGFPLLLSPVIASTGIEIKPLLILETVFMVLLAWLSWYYFRKHFSDGISLLLLLFFTYHSFTLGLKSQILSEIPFTFFLILAIILIRSAKQSIRNWILIGSLCGFLASIRIVGFLIIPSLAALLLNDFVRNNDTVQSKYTNRLNLFFSFTLSSLISFLLLNVCLFNIPLKSIFSFYLHAGVMHDINFFSNLYSYLDDTGGIFSIPYSQNFNWWGIFCVLIILIGFIYSLRRKNCPEDWFLLFYILLLGLYPYASGGFRFLFPVFLFIIRYFFEGLNFIRDKISKARDTKVLFIVCSLLIYAQLRPVYQIWQDRNIVIEGPQRKEALEMFGFIRNNTAADDVVVFPRARVMTLYGERPATYLLQENSPQENAGLFKRLNVKYLVLPKGNEKSSLYDPALWTYFELDSSNLQLQWQNEGFEVYKTISL